MSGYCDLHCHWVSRIDDGAKNVDESIAMLRGLREIGFTTVVATPHMRPGMFDNDRAGIEAGFSAMQPFVASASGMPEIGLGCEHYLDDVTYRRLLEGAGVPYPGGYAALIEINTDFFPVRLTHSFFELQRRGIRPVLAHPERYAPVWEKPDLLEPVVDAGNLLLLDVAALAGKYGRRAERTARALLEDGFYYAACSDAHHPDDVRAVAKGIERLRDLVGTAEADFLLDEGPRSILSGKVET